MTRHRLTPVARMLRKRKTDAEARLWSRLRGRQLDGRRFNSQVIGSAVADFVCHAARLVVELDGGQHATQVEADAERTRLLEAHGYRVVRYWNSDVMSNVDGVLEEIQRMLAVCNNE